MRRSFTVFLLAVFLSVTAFFPYQDSQKVNANPAMLTLPGLMGGGGAGMGALPGIAIGLGIAMGGYCLAASITAGSLTCQFGNKSQASPQPPSSTPPANMIDDSANLTYNGVSKLFQRKNGTINGVYSPSDICSAFGLQYAGWSMFQCSTGAKYSDGSLIQDATVNYSSNVCPGGYTRYSTSLCSLVDASQVPNTTPYDCEIIADIATGNYVTDKKNPACGRPGAVAGSPGSADGSGVAADGTKWRIQGGSVALEDTKGNKAQMTLNPAVPGTGNIETQTPTTAGGNPATRICDYATSVGPTGTSISYITGCSTAPGINNPDIPQINANASGTATNASSGVTNLNKSVQQTDCEIHPTAAGCLDLGDPPTNDIPSDSKSMTFSANPFSLPAGCPAPVSFAAMGRSFSISYQPLCDFAGYIRSLVLISALIAAYFICFGSRREEA